MPEKLVLTTSHLLPSSLSPRALHEGGVAGAVEGLAPKGRRLPPLGRPWRWDWVEAGVDWIIGQDLMGLDRIVWDWIE